MSYAANNLLRYTEALALWISAVLGKRPPHVRAMIATCVAVVAGWFGLSITGDDSVVIATGVIYAAGGIVDWLSARVARRIAAERIEQAKLRFVKIKPDVLLVFALASVFSGCAHWSASLAEVSATAEGSGSVIWTEAGGVSTVGVAELRADALGNICYRSRCVPVLSEISASTTGAIRVCWSVAAFRVCRDIPVGE